MCVKNVHKIQSLACGSRPCAGRWHGPSHEGKGQINEIIRSQCFASGITQVAHTLVDSCMTCRQIRKKGSSIRHNYFPPPLWPFIKSLASVLKFDWQLHVPYYPQSSGQVERMNSINKEKLTKTMMTTGWE